MNIILLPAHNEEKAISVTIKEIRQYTDATIVVALSGCTDKTGEIARDNNCLTIDAPKGKGNAVHHAIKHLPDYDKLVMMDSDFTYPAKYIHAILDKLDSCDAVYGDRKLTDQQSFNSVKNWHWGNHLVSTIASGMYGVRICDVLSGMWGFRKSTLDKLHLTSPEFTLEVDIFTELVRNKCSIGSTPISYRPRLEGDKSKLRRLDHAKILWFLLSRKFA